MMEWAKWEGSEGRGKSCKVKLIYLILLAPAASYSVWLADGDVETNDEPDDVVGEHCCTCKQFISSIK